MCIALSVAARLSINTEGDTALGPIEKPFTKMCLHLNFFFFFSLTSKNASLPFFGTGNCALEEGDSLNCIGGFLRVCDSEADREEE